MPLPVIGGAFAAPASVASNAFVGLGTCVRSCSTSLRLPVHRNGNPPRARVVGISMIAFRIRERGTASTWERNVATARAITPMRRPSADQSAGSAYTEEIPLPSARRSDLMAPKRVGIWSIIPYLAAVVVVGAAGYVAVKRFQARQRSLVEDFGEVMIYYGNSVDAKRDIVQDYKGKLGPGVLRGAMYQSYLRNLVTAKPVGPPAIYDAITVKDLVRISDAKAVQAFNNLGASLKGSPSLLGKLLFLAERCLPPESLSSLTLIPYFPYGEGTVVELQRNMVERCFKDLVTRALDENEDSSLPVDAANALRINTGDAQKMFDQIVVERIKAREDEAAALEAAESEDASKPHVGDLDYPARSGQPAKADVHAFQCSQCGYTMFPAAGREFKCEYLHAVFLLVVIMCCDIWFCFSFLTLLRRVYVCFLHAMRCSSTSRTPCAISVPSFWGRVRLSDLWRTQGQIC